MARISSNSPEIQTSCLPSKFAIQMAGNVDLYDVSEEFETRFTDHDRLEMFQSVCVSGTLEESLAAGYFGKKLTKQQLIVLEAIYKLTNKWLVGKLSQNLLDRLDIVSGMAQRGKDVADITEKIMQLMNVISIDEEQSKEGAGPTRKMVIEHTNVVNLKERKQDKEMA